MEEVQQKCVTVDMVFKRAYANSKDKDILTHEVFVLTKYKKYCAKMESLELYPAHYFQWLQCQVN